MTDSSDGWLELPNDLGLWWMQDKDGDSRVILVEAYSSTGINFRHLGLAALQHAFHGKFKRLDPPESSKVTVHDTIRYWSCDFQEQLDKLVSRLEKLEANQPPPNPASIPQPHPGFDEGDVVSCMDSIHGFEVGQLVFVDEVYQDGFSNNGEWIGQFRISPHAASFVITPCSSFELYVPRSRSEASDPSAI